MAPPPRAGVGSRYRIAIALAASFALAFTASHLAAQVVPGKNVNMVAGTDWPGGDPFLQRQNEPSIAVSSRNEQHLLAGANDYRTVDLPGSPLTKPSGDAWLGVFKSLDGGQTWKSTLLPGYPQDTVNTNSPLKGYDAGADPAVRAGSNGLFFYSGIAFQRAVPTAANSAVRDSDERKTSKPRKGKVKAKLKNEKSPQAKARSIPESDTHADAAAQGAPAAGSAVFVSTFIDLNNRETGDPIAYVRTSIVDSDSGSRFLDKQWIGVDVPRANASMCSFQIPQADGDPVVQEFPGGRIYVAYTAFVGPESNNNAQIMVSYSANCGESWSPPRNISMVPDPDVNDDGMTTIDDVNLVKALVGKRCGNDGFLPAFDLNQDCVINLLDLAVISRNLGKSYSTVRRVPQGATIAIHPLTGAVYIAWREFKNGALPDVIQVVRSTDFGVTFSAPMTVSSLAPYDQGTSIGSFRSNAFPTIAADASRVYLAWASRGYATTNASPAGESRIVMSTSTDGTSWSAPYAIDEPNRPGHQLMPALTFGAGKLSLIYYDLREDVSQLFGPFVDELPILNAPSPKPPRHTMDVRLAQADPGPAPVFRSTQLSEYAFGVVPGTSVAQQLTFNPPNLTLFRQGTVPFMGDYIDLITAPSIRANADGTWAFNIEPGSASGGYAVWTDNRNVRAGPGGDLTDYTPPNSRARGAVSRFDPSVVLPQCEPGQTGTRNQDIFGARFDQGLIAGALGNTKTLGPVQRGFALLIQNTTSQTRSYRLTILDQPVGGQASFRQFEAPLTVLDVSIPRLSSVARTAYVSASDPTARVTISVDEISAPGAPSTLSGGLHSAIVINGDASNPAIENPAIENPAIENKDIQAVEVYNPRINPAIENPAIENPAIENPAIENPAIENVTVANQGIINPAIENPAIENPAIENPAIENPAIENVTLANGSISDTTWTLTNDGNTSAVYAVKLLLNQAVPNGILTQLIIHKPYTTPAAAPNCELKVQLHNNILVNITTPAFAVHNPAAPAIENPAIENPAIENPAIENATVALAPGETAFVTIRAFDPDKTDAITFSPAAAVTPAAVAQSVNTEDITPGEPPPPPPAAVSTTIAVPDLADAIFLSGNYGQQLYASVPGTWAIVAGALPPGVNLSPTGLFSGVPTTPGTYNFTVQFTSSALPVQTVQRSFTVNIAQPLAIVTPALPDALTGFAYSASVNSVGGVNPKVWTVSSGSLPAGVTLNPATGALNGTPTSAGTFNFTLQVVDSASTPNTASASFALTVADQGSFERTWIGVDSNFSNPANWSPTGVPTATDDVLLNGPEAIAVLSADVTVHNLTLINGATIDTNGFTLTVTGDLQAGTTITGSGLVRMTGVDATASGTVSNLHVAAGASVTLSAPLHVTGHLTLGGGMLLGGFPLTVDGLLIVPEGLEFTPGILGDGALVTVGGLDVAALVLDNAPVMMTNGTFVRFDNVQFQSFPPQTTRLTISGAGSAAPITLQTPRFLETPTTGFYIKATDTADDQYALTIHVTNPQAVDGPAHTLEVSGAAVIWATQLADLTLTQQDSADPVAVGGSVTYSFVVTNTGSETAYGAQLIDTLPPLVTFVPGSSSSSCVNGSGVVTCALGDVNPGGSVAVSITVQPSAAGTISNIAQVFSTTPDSNVADNQAVEQTTVTGVAADSADLSITKTHSPAEPTVGANLTYTLTVTNHGPSAATVVSLVDTLPAGVSFVSVSNASCANVSGTVTCNLSTLASGASVAVNIVVTPTASQVVSNTAAVTSVTGDPVEANNTATDTVMVAPFAPCATQAWSAPAYVPVGPLSPTGLLTTADFDGDGNIDVATTASSLPVVAVMFGDGAGGFGTPVQLTLPAIANSIIATDLNHDARPDLMLAVGSTMVVLLRDEAGDAGAFTPAAGSPYSTAIAGFGLATGLFNGDAHLDVAVSQFTGNTVAVLLGNGNGGFGSATTYPSGTNPINVMVRDFNGDGKADLAVPNQGTSTISILSGDGLGAFAAPVVTTLPATVNRLRDLGDINSDGFPDLGVTITTGGLMLLINDQVGGFAAPVTVLSGISIGFVPPAVDLNGDGAVDLVAGSSNDGGFHVLYGDGAGAFPTQTRIVVGTGLNNHDVVDLNGDDRPDIVATRPNALPGQIVVVLNNCGTTDTANLTVTQSGPASATAGERLTYSVTVTNNGPMTATGVMLIDVPSAGLAFESASVACTDQGNAVSCALPAITSGASATVDFELLAIGAGARFNIAQATAQQFDSNLNDNIATVPTAVSASPVTFVVTTTADAGTGSLRQAILNSNANPGSTNQIHFNIGESPTYSIGLLTALPTITAPVVIDGWTENGAGYAGPPVVELNGQATSSGNGLTITAGGSTVRGLVLNRFKGAGISLQTLGGNAIQGNYIGTDLAGMTAAANLGGAGVTVVNSANNTIGGTIAAHRNVISGNANIGVAINTASGNIVQGNYIGTDVTGTVIVANGQHGVTVSNAGATGNVIGGAAPGAGNVISGNGNAGTHGFGVHLLTNSFGTTVQGNRIGTNAAGTAALPNANGGVDVNSSNGNLIGGTIAGAGNLISGNGSGAGQPGDLGEGITLFGTSTANLVQGNLIGTNVTGGAALTNTGAGVMLGGAGNIVGGTTTAARNVISGNGGDGIYIFGAATGSIVEGNFIGTDITGLLAIPNFYNGVAVDPSASGISIGTIGAGNTIAFNSGAGVRVADGVTGVAIRGNNFFGNGGLGIDLRSDGLTANDPGDADTGANNLQNFPVLTSASHGNTMVVGTLNSTPSTQFTLDFYANGAPCNASTEGQRYLGSGSVTTDGDGNGSFNLTLTGSSVASESITATATDPNGNTSEFSGCVGMTSPSAAVVTIAATDASASEVSSDAGTFAVTRTGSTASALVVEFSIGGTASNGADYASISTSVTIPAGSASAAIVVTPVDDATGEGAETVVITLSDAEAYDVGSPDSATVTIADNDSAAVTATDPTASEVGDPATFTVSRGPTETTTSDRDVVVSLAGTATHFTDYNLTGNIVSNQTAQIIVRIPEGASSTVVTLLPLVNAANLSTTEGNETVELTAEGSTASATIVDEPLATVSVSDASATETGDVGAFVVSRGAGALTTFNRDVVVAVAGTATNFTDYQFTGSIVSNQAAQLIVRIPSGQASTVVTLTPAADAASEGVETAILTAETGPSATVNIADAQSISLALVGTQVVGKDRSAALLVTLAQPAPAGGIVISITSDDINLLTVAAPGTITIPQGQSTGQIMLNGVNVGVTTVRGNASGFPEATRSVIVTLNVITTPSALTVPLSQTTALSISIPNPAPAGGLVFDVVSANPSVIEVMTPQVTVPAGALAVNAVVRGAGPGTASVAVTRSDYAASATAVTSAANLNIVEATASFTASFTAQPLTVRLESSGSPVAAPSDLIVTLTPVDATCISVPASVTIPIGQVSATFVPAYGGSANLPCTSVVTASAAGPSSDTVSITANSAGAITVPGVQTVGAGLQFAVSGSLGTSQHGGVAVNITSSDPARVLVSPNGTTAGSASIVVNVANGSATVPFVVQGLENLTGSATITASSSAFTSDTMTVNLVASAVQVVGLPTSMTSLAAESTSWYVQTGLPNAGNTSLNQVQEVRAGGPPFVVTLSNSNAAVAQLRSDQPAATGQVVTKPIQPNIYYTNAIVPGTSYGLGFDPLGGGTTTVTVAGPAGVVGVPVAGATVTVTSAGISMPSPQTVGAGLQLSTSAALEGSQHGGVAVTVSSSAPGVLLVSPNATTAGTDSFVVNVANGTTSVPIYVQGIENTTGTAIVSVSAPGFTTDTVTMTVARPAVQIVSLATSTTSLSADDNSWYVQTGLPNAANTGLNQVQHVRAGGPPFVVTLSNSNADVAQLRSDEPAATGQIVTKPIQPNIYYTTAIASGTSYGLAFDPLGGGSTTVTARGPAGVVSVPANGVTVTVTAAGISMPSPQTVGAGLQLSTPAALEGSQHGGVAVTVSSSAPGVLLVSPNATTAGTASFVINLANGATSVPFYVQGVENTTGTAIVSVSAPGFTTDTVTMTVARPAVQIVGLATSTTSLSADNTSWYVQVGLPNAGNTSLNQVQNVRAGGPPFVVTLSNSNAAVAQLRSDQPAATGQVVSKPIQPNIYYTNAVAPGTSQGLAFDPLGGGTTTVTVTGPAGVGSVPPAGVTVSVTSAGISMPSPQTVGAGLQLSTPASLEGSQHGGVAVTVSSSAPGVLRVSPNATTAGTASFVINLANGATSVPFYVQGVENTVGTAIVSVSAPGFTTGTVTMSVAQPAIEIVNLPTSANAAAGELTAWYVQVGVPNAGHTQLNQVQSVRTGGPAFVVTLRNSNDAVAELRSDEPVTTGQVVTKPIQPNFYYTNSIAPGTSQGLAFRPLAAGTTSVSATGPSGVIGVDGATRTVSVTGVPTLVSIAATDSDATEAGATTGTFTITRSAVTAQSLQVSYTRSGSATGGSDFTNFSSTSVFIPANQASVSITVTPIADQIVESPETVTLTLANGAGYDLGGSTQATVTIADDPTIVSIEAIDPDASEAGTNTGRFRLTRSGGSTAALSVSYTRSGTAVAGTDYSNNFSATFVTIPAGQPFVEIVVTPLVNVATEPPETVILTLSSTAQYTLGATSQATVTIIDGPS